ncbi:galactoside-O-acetyltransferase [Secundilactobacillus odoratitofui DSM 19909 = JCM 15043]|uniref:Acetyltransferase n=1 Tax=Secundilactobacillus odoratitofui DSM 19909 = JCM 15043 TaxID=1423776 RepID=A0A0R1LPV9_9LACO|nr:sugar O-acetyltransferase [Secundilactobacillus odoratitofui]KRK97584.1 galactoside-O-acetyltransferase [Secundilactobacillus odoratitofui DSM 19909 = JCM 15043]
MTESLNYQRMLNGELYHQTPELLEIRMKARDLLFEYNRLNYRDLDSRKRILKELLGSVGENYFFELPLHLDYGFNVKVGENFFANSNLTLLDTAPIEIGDDVLIAPNVSIYTAGHALDPELRVRTGAEYAVPVKIGNRVWIGGSVTICPGVTIGDNSVIGAGAVVTKSIPANSLAYGNPARVVRQFDERDKKYYFKQRKISQEWLDKLANGETFHR